jgi:tetratricopeptide (TPR) repeat protein
MLLIARLGVFSVSATFSRKRRRAMTVEAKMIELCKNLALELIPKGITAAAATHGVTIPPEITRTVLKSFIELLLEEKKIDDRLDKLLGSYYKDGMEYITQAEKVQQPDRRVRWIEKAIERFTTASNVEKDPLIYKSQFYIGVCYDLLGEMILAKDSYEKAYRLAYQRVIQVTKNAELLKTKRVKIGDRYIDMPEGGGYPFGTPAGFRKVTMDEIVRWWNEFKNIDHTYSLPKPVTLSIPLEEYKRLTPKERHAISEKDSKKMDTYMFVTMVWSSLNEQQRKELNELRSFSNSLKPVLRASGSTIVP